MTRVFLFSIRLNGHGVGQYGAFDESEGVARERVEAFFRPVNPAYKVEAVLVGVMETKDAKDSILFGIPVFDRRSLKREA